MKHKINILFFLGNIKAGGQEKMILTYANALNKKKFNVYIGYINNGHHDKQKLYPYITFLKLKGSTDIKNFRKIPLHLYTILKLVSILKKYRIDIIESNGVYSYLIGGIAARLSGTLHVRIPGSLMKLIEPTFTRLFSCLKLYYLADLFIPGLRVMKQELIDYGVKEKKIKEIFLTTVDLEKFHPGISGHKVKNEFNLTDKDIIVGVVSRIAANRGIDILIKSSKEVLKEFKNVKFLIVGDGPLRKEYEYLVESEKVDDYFIFTGWREDTLEVIAAIDIGVLAPRELAGGTFLREVMACAKPVITTDDSNGAQKEWIRHNKTGILISPHNIENNLAEALLDLLRHQEKRKRIGKTTRKYMERHYSLDKTINELENTFIDLVKKCT